jgi:hypothetical protein
VRPGFNVYINAHPPFPLLLALHIDTRCSMSCIGAYGGQLSCLNSDLIHSASAVRSWYAMRRASECASWFFPTLPVTLCWP